MEKAESLNSESKNSNKFKSEAIDFRRNKVIELKAQGLDQIDIAARLQVSPATITSDLQYLRDEAKQNLKDYTTKDLPLQFKVFVKSLHQAIQTYWRLSQEAKDDHNKIAAIEHYVDAHQTLLNLLLGGEKYEDNSKFKEIMNKERDIFTSVIGSRY